MAGTSSAAAYGVHRKKASPEKLRERPWLSIQLRTSFGGSAYGRLILVVV
jgi:hypothetical protein